MKKLYKNRKKNYVRKFVILIMHILRKKIISKLFKKNITTLKLIFKNIKKKEKLWKIKK